MNFQYRQVRQGDALFNIAFDSVVKQVLNKAERIKINDNQQLAILAYADDLVILENELSLKESTKELIRAGKEIGRNINGEKTKHLILSRKQHTVRKLEV